MFEASIGINPLVVYVSDVNPGVFAFAHDVSGPRIKRFYGWFVDLPVLSYEGDAICISSLVVYSFLL